MKFAPRFVVIMFVTAMLTSCSGGGLKSKSGGSSDKSLTGVCQSPVTAVLRPFSALQSQILENQDVVWEVQINGGCATKYQVIMAGATAVEVFAAPTGSTMAYPRKVGGYSVGNNKTESASVIATNASGILAPVTVQSLPFNVVSNTTAIGCSAAVNPNMVNVLLNPDGSMNSFPQTFLTVNIFDRATPTTAVAGRVNTILSSFSNAYTGPSPVATSHLLTLTLRALGDLPLLIQVEDNAGHQAICDTSVRVTGNPTAVPPVVNLTVSATAAGMAVDGPITVAMNQPAYLSWSAQNADSCSIAGLTPPGPLATSGSAVMTPNLSADASFTLSCTGAAGTTTDTVVVKVAGVDLKVNNSDGPLAVAYESNLTASWTSAGTAGGNCSLNVGNLSGLSNTGVAIGRATANQTITITCTGTGWSVSDSVVVTANAPTNHILFATSQVYNGQGIGGLAGGDQKCQDLAEMAGLRPDRPWVAVLSTDNVNAKNRFSLVGDVLRSDAARTVITTAGNFWRVGTDWNATTLDETGGNPTQQNVWTGTQESGDRFAGLTCSNWTSNGGSGSKGYAGDPRSLQRIQDASDLAKGCGNQYRIYCISQ